MHCSTTRTAVIVAATLLLATVCAAQQTPGSTNYRVDGTVVDAETGQPLKNVAVQVSPGPYCCGRPELSAASAADGAFSLPLKRRSMYVLLAKRDGYVTDWSQNLSQCSPCNVTVRLHAESKLSGRVVAADSKEPMAQVTVEAIRLSYGSGMATPFSSARTVSDRDGEFALTQLTPGQYYFRFTPSEIPAMPIVTDTHDPPAQQFKRQWWPGGDAYQKASPFVLVAGTALRLPDVLIPSAALFRVSGTVTPATCDSEDRYTVSIGKQTGASIQPFSSMVVRCGAEFAFVDLAPGRYQISLLPKDPGQAASQQELVVTDRNLQTDLPPARTAR